MKSLPTTALPRRKRLRSFRRPLQTPADFARLALRWMFRMMPALLLASMIVPSAFSDQDAAVDDGKVVTPQTAGDSRDKSSYNLFNPTPSELMRGLSPDRPDKTESPYTVDAGHFQVEMDFANFTYDYVDGMKIRAWNVAPFNVKIGLLNNADLQFVFDDYISTRTDDKAAGTTVKQSGIGDFTLRLKVNLWGNDGGQTALALLPYVKFPTSTAGLGNNAIEGGLILPLTLKLPDDFEMTIEAAGGVFRNNANHGRHGEFIQSVSVDHPIAGKLSGYVEFFSNVSGERRAGWEATVDAGLEYLLTNNIQLDCGCNFGVTRAADAFNPFAGITIRF